MYCVSHKGEKLQSISIANEGICELYKVKYMDKKMHFSTQTNDIEEEGKYLVIFAFLSIFSTTSVSKATGILVTI